MQRRQKIWVHSKTQGQTLGRLVLYWGAYHLVLWHLMFLGHMWKHVAAADSGTQSETFLSLYAQFFEQYSLMIPIALIAFPVIAMDALSLTHRIVGPVVRFKRCLQGIAAGEKVSEITLRKGDLLADLSDELNAAIRSLNKRNEPAQPELEQAVLDDIMFIQADLWRAQKADNVDELPRHTLEVLGASARTAGTKASPK